MSDPTRQFRLPTSSHVPASVRHRGSSMGALQRTSWPRRIGIPLAGSVAAVLLSCSPEAATRASIVRDVDAFFQTDSLGYTLTTGQAWVEGEIGVTVHTCDGEMLAPYSPRAGRSRQYPIRHDETEANTTAKAVAAASGESERWRHLSARTVQTR